MIILSFSLTASPNCNFRPLCACSLLLVHHRVSSSLAKAPLRHEDNMARALLDEVAGSCDEEDGTVDNLRRPISFGQNASFLF